jgi:VWFA-related protein
MTKLNLFGGLLVCVALLSTAEVPAQSQERPGQSEVPPRAPLPTLIPRSHEEREARFRAQHRIILNVLVTDSSGKPVTGLRQEDFAILDNQHLRAIASFRAVNGGAVAAATHVLLMLDTINNSPRGITSERQEIEKFLRHGEGHLAYPTSIGIFSGNGASVGRASKDGGVLAGDLQRLLTNVHGFNCAEEGLGRDVEFAMTVYGTDVLPASLEGSPEARVTNCLNERFKLSVSTLNRLAREQIEVPGREILIWIGPGWPRLSDREFSPDTAGIRENFFAYLVELSTALHEGQVTLDAVSMPDLFRKAEMRSDHDNLFFDGVPNEEQVTAGSLSLRALAHQSGGRILEDGKDIASEISECVADAEFYYVLSFDFAPSAEPGEYRSLGVSVNKPGLTVRTNTVYYAQP